MPTISSAPPACRPWRSTPAFNWPAWRFKRDPQLLSAQTLLMIPDLFQFLLSGEKRVGVHRGDDDPTLRSASALLVAGDYRQLELAPANLSRRLSCPGPCSEISCLAFRPIAASQADFPPIAVASHDTASAVAAIPDLDDHSVLLSSGTWSLMGVAADEPNLSDEFFHLGFTNEGSAEGGVLLLRNLTGLWILQECVRIWDEAGAHYSWADLEEAASKAAHFRSFIDPSASELQSPTDMCAAVQALLCAKPTACPANCRRDRSMHL